MVNPNTIDTSCEQMIALCHSFPTLRGMPGTSPWDQHAFAEWLRTSPAVTSGSAMAGRFVLEVWNGGYPSKLPEPWWKQPPFDVCEAIAIWDSRHRAAFLAWCNDPFWP